MLQCDRWPPHVELVLWETFIAALCPVGSEGQDALSSTQAGWIQLLSGKCNFFFDQLAEATS